MSTCFRRTGTRADPRQFIGYEIKNLSPEIDKNGEILIDEATLYHPVSLEEFTESIVTIEFIDPGLQVFAFTFGSYHQVRLYK